MEFQERRKDKKRYTREKADEIEEGLNELSMHNICSIVRNKNAVFLKRLINRRLSWTGEDRKSKFGVAHNHPAIYYELESLLCKSEVRLSNYRINRIKSLYREWGQYYRTMTFHSKWYRESYINIIKMGVNWLPLALLQSASTTICTLLYQNFSFIKINLK